MNKSILLASCVIVTTGCAFAAQPKEKAQAQEFYAVQVFGFDGKASNMVMTASELAAAKKQVDAESKVLKKAVQMADEEWKAEGIAKKAFPKSGISARKVKETGPYPDAGKAQAKVSTLVERQQKRQEEEVREITRMQQNLRMKPDEIKDREKDAAEEESRNNLARTMVSAKIAELLSAATAEGSAGKPATQAAGKAGGKSATEQ